MKSVTLLNDQWQDLLAILKASPHDRARSLQACIDEQISGAVKVRVTRGSVHLKAGKGGDLRNSGLLR